MSNIDTLELKLPVEARTTPQEVVMASRMHASSSLFDSVARDVAGSIMEMLDMKYDDELVRGFLCTSDGVRLVSSLARMLSYMNEKKVAELDGLLRGAIK